MNLLVNRPVVARELGWDFCGIVKIADREARKLLERRAAHERAKRYREDARQLRRVCERHQIVAYNDAGAFGDLYCGMDHYEALDLALRCMREALDENARG